MLERFPITLHLGLLALICSLSIGLSVGLIAAVRRGKWPDKVFTPLTYLGVTIPVFWLGILLILLLSVHWGLFSAGGFPGWSADFWGSLKALILPAFALGIIRAAILTRLTRSSMLEVLREDYIRTARAKGLRERTVIYVHALKNALIPVLTILGLQLGQLMAGAIIIENVYYLPAVLI